MAESVFVNEVDHVGISSYSTLSDYLYWVLHELSPLNVSLMQHAKDEKCGDCRRFFEYYYGKKSNKYKTKPLWPACPTGIKTIKSYFYKRHRLGARRND